MTAVDLLPMLAWLPESPALGAERRGGLPLALLFRDGRAGVTLLLWLANFTNVLDAYFVASWLPTAVRASGFPTATAVLVGAAVQAGGAIGTVVLGPVLQRRGFVPVLTACFVGAAAALAVIARPGLPLALLVLVAFLAGWGIFAGQPGLNALAATSYPPALRSTGIGAGLGVGRFGAILGPLVASALLERAWSYQALFRVAAVPALVSALAVVAMGLVVRAGSGRAGGGALAPPPGPR